MLNYRKKIYRYYSSNSGRSLAPKDIDGLSPRAPFYTALINKFFPENKNIKILEIGCGYGAFQYFMNQAGYTDTEGIDTSEEQVSEAHRLGIQHVVQRDLVEYLQTLDDSTVDLLIAIDVIEHFNKEELSDLVDLFYRVLKKGGEIITHQPNAGSPFGGSIRYGDFTHELAFTPSSIAQLFLSSGFSEVHSYEDRPIVHGIKSALRLFLWDFVITPVYKFLWIVESGGIDKEMVFSKNFISVIKK